MLLSMEAIFLLTLSLLVTEAEKHESHAMTVILREFPRLWETLELWLE